MNAKGRTDLFHSEILAELKRDFQRVQSFDSKLQDGDDDDDNDDMETLVGKYISWLKSPPESTIFRVNTLLTDREAIMKIIIERLEQNLYRPMPRISTFCNIPEMIMVDCWDKGINLNLEKYKQEIIVDVSCGTAILRGAHIYAPGVLGMPKGLKKGDRVSIYVDVSHSCKKGLIKEFDDECKLFIGNGIVNLTREKLFGSEEQANGIAIFITETISRIPQLSQDLFPNGWTLLQNLPSILCSRILNPQCNDLILDMCAAPGNKTTHIANLMQNQGKVIALEKIKSKINKLVLNIKDCGLENVSVFCYDSTKAVSDIQENFGTNEPPFPKLSFDKILLDAPCSGLGQRPQIRNSITLKQLRSYVPLQRKLFSTAVELLKPGGVLVYSTCTITIAENEGIIAWALKSFPHISLKSADEDILSEVAQFITDGYIIDGLSAEEVRKLCRRIFDTSPSNSE